MSNISTSFTANAGNVSITGFTKNTTTEITNKYT